MRLDELYDFFCEFLLDTIRLVLEFVKPALEWQNLLVRSRNLADKLFGSFEGRNFIRRSMSNKSLIKRVSIKYE